MSQDKKPPEQEGRGPSDKLQSLRNRMPDYFKAFGLPWYIAIDLFRHFVDDDEVRVTDWGHVRNLFAIGASLDAALRRARQENEALEKKVQELADDRSCCEAAESKP